MNMNLESEELTALNRITHYNYKINPTIKDDTPVLVEIIETVDLTIVNSYPIYDVYINGYQSINDRTEETIPSRFVHVMNCIDYYIDNNVGF